MLRGSLYLSVAGPGGLVESRPELHTELVMATRGCSWNPFGNKAVIRSWRIPRRTPRISLRGQREASRRIWDRGAPAPERISRNSSTWRAGRVRLRPHAPLPILLGGNWTASRTNPAAGPSRRFIPFRQKRVTQTGLRDAFVELLFGLSAVPFIATANDPARVRSRCGRFHGKDVSYQHACCAGHWFARLDNRPDVWRSFLWPEKRFFGSF